MSDMIKKLNSLSRDKLFRSEKERKELETAFDRIVEDAKLANKHASEHKMDHVPVEKLNSVLEEFYGICNEQANLEEKEYGASENEFIEKFHSLYRRKLFYFDYCFIEVIMNPLRKTMNIDLSVKKAKSQLEKSGERHEKQVCFWSVMSSVSVALFFGLVWFFWDMGFKGTGQVWSQQLYYGALRIASLGVAGALMSFCFRMFRAHKHMQERNRHRQDIVNSIESFIKATNHDQRDMMLAKLVETVIEFGSSGLLAARDDLGSPTKLAVDSVLRNIPTKN